jgi:hypothetical protein
MNQQKRVRASWWNTYQNYVRSVVLPNQEAGLKDISYWRNEIFFNALFYITPLSIIALIPGVYMSFVSHVPVVAFVDMFAFFLLIGLLIKS